MDPLGFKFGNMGLNNFEECSFTGFFTSFMGVFC